MKKIIIIFLLFNLKLGHAVSIEPEVFVQSTVNRASQVLSKNISKDEKINNYQTKLLIKFIFMKRIIENIIYHLLIVY